MKNILKKLKLFVIFFLIINITAFAYLANIYTIGRPYKIAKLNMAGATWFNMAYAIPLQKIFGYRNSISMPAIKLRDYFYDNGIKYIPENDGERNIWWARIYATEEKDVIFDISQRMYILKNEKPTIPLEVFFKRLDNDYLNIYPLANLPIKDKRFEKNRLKWLSRLIRLYSIHKFELYSHSHYKSGDDFYFYDNAFFKDKEEVGKIEKILDVYLTIKKRYPEDYFKKISKQESDADNYVLNETSSYILTSKMLRGDLSCSDKNIKLYENSYKYLKEAIKNPEAPDKWKEFILEFTLESEIAKHIKNHLEVNCSQY